MGYIWEQVGRDVVSKVSRNQILKGLGSHNQEAGVILKKMGSLEGGEASNKMRHRLEEGKVGALALIYARDNNQLGQDCWQ